MIRGRTDALVSGNVGTSTGTVQIYDGTTLLETETLQGNGEGYYYISYGVGTR